MSTIVLMKAFERNPGIYDLGMRIVTFGKIDRLHQEIAGSVSAFGKVLDAGCGTGKMLPILARRGATIAAIDKSPEMIALAIERAKNEEILNSVRISQNTIMEVDRLYQDAEFDTIVLSMVMTELTKDEQQWVLKQCARILKPSGTLLLGDEFLPEGFLRRIAAAIFRFPLHLTAYIYTQIKELHTSKTWWKLYYIIVELPLMLISFLISEPLTRPLRRLESMLPANLEIASTTTFLAGTVRVLKIKKLS